MVVQIFFHHRACWTSLNTKIKISTEACGVKTSYHTECTKPLQNTFHSHYSSYLPLLFIITTNSDLHNNKAKHRSCRYEVTDVSNDIFWPTSYLWSWLSSVNTVTALRVGRSAFRVSFHSSKHLGPTQHSVRCVSGAVS